MKHVITTLAAIAVVCGVSFAKEPSPASEHLKCYDGLIGTWRYEGPLLEDLPDVAKKGSPLVFQVSWRRILNKAAVEENWSIQVDGAEVLSGKGLIGWNAEEKRIVHGDLNSVGDMSLGEVTVDEDNNSLPLTTEGIDAKGEKTEFKGVVTKKDKDTITWQALHRKGGIVEGPSPEYTFKRVERPKGTKPAK